MKKYWSHAGGYIKKIYSCKIFELMRNTLLLIFIVVFQASANDTYSQNARLTLNLNDVTIAKVLEEIENNSEFYFLFNAKLIDVERKVSISMEDKKISEILPSLFSGTDIHFMAYDKQIILTPSDVTLLSAKRQQQKQITGTVTDKEGIPIPGVNVVVTGTTQGTMTDIDGKYNIEVPSGSSSLTFSFVGMDSQEISVKNLTQIDVTMVESAIGLEEVVVIGYGVQNKKDLTGSIASVSGDFVSEKKSTQVSQALEGTISGVMVLRNAADGVMGSSTIRIRGITTIGNSSPLIIVDGVPVSDIDQVNPNDIENITVLKDAASASIYGSRAAAGVILVTTKRAKIDQASVNYTFETGFDTPTQTPDFGGAVRYMKMWNEMVWNDGGNGADQYPTYAKDLIDGYAEKHAADPDQYPDVDMVDMCLTKYAPHQAHMLSFTAGSKFVKSIVSIKYEKIGGLFDNKDFKRIFARTSNDFTISKIIGGSFDLSLNRNIDIDPTFQEGGVYSNAGVLAAIIRHPAIYPVIWADGRVAPGKQGDNTWGVLKYGGNQKHSNNQISSKFSMDLKPLDGLIITGALAPVFNLNEGKTYANTVYAYSATDPTQLLNYLQNSFGYSKLVEDRNSDYSLTTQLLINYMKTIGNNDFTALAGYENFYFKSESIGASRDQYLFDNYPYLDLGPKTVIDNSGSAYETAYRSYFGRLTYSYKSKYLLQGNIRYDGSSRFADDCRWGLFPSISGGWILSEESFMKGQSIVNFLKLRASWGALGNERIGNYPYLGIISFSNVALFQNHVAASQQSAAQIQYAINNISWEKTESSDIGVEANFLNNRLRFTGDVYSKQTKDMLLALQIPMFVGFKNPEQNTGKMSTKGIDLDLSWIDKIGDLEYSASFNLSQFKSKMGDLGGTEFIGDQVKIEGSDFNEWYGYIAEGIYQTQEEVDNSPKLNNNIRPGDIKYRDVHGPDGVPDGIISPEYDRVLLGSSQPQWIYGGSIKLGYKGIDFLLVFQGIGKQLRSMHDFVLYCDSRFGNFPTYLDGKMWSTYNTPEQNLTATLPRLTYNNQSYNQCNSSSMLFNGRYFRMKNITLGYTIPERISQKVMINNLRIFASASDLFSISKYPKGYDPEGLGIVATVIGGISVTF
jgi:TonB-linked SusC/RagA family outer membrane protein